MATKKNAAAVELGRRGAKRRNEILTAEQRQEIARKAGKAGAKARWGTPKQSKQDS